MADLKIFTIGEAERTLPLLGRVLADLRVEYDIWREALGDYELLAAGTRADDGETPALIEARTDLTASADRINGFLLELESIGCLFKGFEEGLVDFYALRDDRLVFLCWRLGEKRIAHWHEVDVGFAGRQPIDQAAFSAVIP